MSTDISTIKIVRYFGTKAPQMIVDVVEQTESTNSDLLARAATLSLPAALIAKKQTGGRGRAGREWFSAPGAALAFSVAWPFRSIQSLAGLPLVVGVALVEALQLLGVRTELKWPNDILKDGKKLGGILIETAKTDKDVWAVIGVGLNLLLPEDVENKVSQPVASVPWLAQMDHNQLMAGLLEKIAVTLEQFSESGFAPYMQIWSRYHAHQGKQVILFDEENSRYEGVAKGIDSHGRLLLGTITGEIQTFSGEVSLRVKE